jgi:G-patch domain
MDLYGDLPEAKFTPADTDLRPSSKAVKSSDAVNAIPKTKAPGPSDSKQPPAAPKPLAPLLPMALKQRQRPVVPAANAPQPAQGLAARQETSGPLKPVVEKSREEQLMMLIEAAIPVSLEDDVFPTEPYYPRTHHSQGSSLTSSGLPMPATGRFSSFGGPPPLHEHDYQQEYDPFRPNDYSACLARKRRKTDEEERQKKQAREEAEAREKRHQQTMDLDENGSSITEAAAAVPTQPAAPATTTTASVSALSLGLARGRGGVDMRPAWMKKQEEEQQQQQAAASAAATEASGGAQLTAALAAEAPVPPNQQNAPTSEQPQAAPTIEISAIIAAALQRTAAAAASNQQQLHKPSPFASLSSSSSSLNREPAAPIRGFTHISDKAKRMMSKMGYKEGKGLGKDGSGIVEALVHVKTGRTSGVIRGGGKSIKTIGKYGDRGALPPPPAGWESDYGGGPGLGGGAGYGRGNAAGSFVAASSSSNSAANVNHRVVTAAPASSRIVLLRNLVGAGEVDDELEEEVTEEASSKYGPVKQVLIYECIVPASEGPGSSTAPTIAPEDAVRIFVEFSDQTSADKALAGFNGRFFGKRQVTAEFFDEAKYDKLDLAPE